MGHVGTESRLHQSWRRRHTQQLTAACDVPRRHQQSVIHPQDPYIHLFIKLGDKPRKPPGGRRSGFCTERAALVPGGGGGGEPCAWWGMHRIVLKQISPSLQSFSPIPTRPVFFCARYNIGHVAIGIGDLGLAYQVSQKILTYLRHMLR